MDAAPTTAVATVARTTEALSGMPLLRVAGYWQGPAEAEPPAAVEVWYDLQVAIRTDLTRSAAADVPAGHARYDFGTQLPVEPAAREVAVVLTGSGGPRLVRRLPLAAVGDEGTSAPAGGIVRRTVRSITSGEVLSPGRWAARLGRGADKLAELRQKVSGKLLSRRFRPRSPHDAYVENTRLTPRLRAAMAEAMGRFRHTPTFSLLVPVYNVDPRWLRRAVESVRGQIYPRWELCLADDASTRPDLRRTLDRLPRDPRIKLARRPTNGHICHASNTAADLATGAFVALLDHDDELAPHALWAVAERFQQHPDADLVYSDEDKIDAAGRRYDPQFKPDWSPELLLSYNYVNHFTVIRRSVFEAAGRFRPGFEGSQDHDLLLRVTERTDRVQHIPEILYHWRSLPDSTAGDAGVKPYVHTSGRRAVEEALARRGLTAVPYIPQFAQTLGLPVLALDGPDSGPTVAVLVYGDPAAGERTAEAVRRATDYRDFTVTVVPAADEPAAALNAAAAGRGEDLLLFLEAGAEPAGPRWLSRLVANLLPGVGAAGAKVTAADGTVIDAGPTLGMRDGVARAPAFAGLRPGQISYYFYAEATRNTAAASGRSLLTRRDLFARLGGFDAAHFPRTLWDVDYGMAVRAAGLRCVTVAGAEVRIAPPPRCGEGAGGWGLTAPPSELLAFKRAHGRPADPYHNPNAGEAEPWRPGGDTPLTLPAEATRPAVRALVAAHNLNNPEGAPRYLSEIVLGLRDRGAIDPVVFSPLGGAGESVYTAAGVRTDVRETAVSRRFVDGLWTPREYAAAQRALAAVLRDHRPEVVVANTLNTFPVVEAAARAGVPAVWIIHESYSAEHLARLFPPFARRQLERAFALASRVVPASHDTASLFARLNTRGNVRVLHNGLDPRPFDDDLRRVTRADARARLAADPARKRIVAVGTVCERKGQHTLVEAAARLAAGRDDFVVDLVGVRPGLPYAQYAGQLVERHRLQSAVCLTAETNAVWAHLRAADVFVCTSYVEAYSRAVLEALAFGLPVVSTPCPGVGEQVVWGANALRYDFGDATGLAAHLARLLDDDALREGMGRQSRALFDAHLDAGEMLDRYAAVVLSAARTGPRGRTAPAPLPLPDPARRAA